VGGGHDPGGTRPHHDDVEALGDHALLTSGLRGVGRIARIVRRLPAVDGTLERQAITVAAMPGTSDSPVPGRTIRR
jgi:hypothetical protein